MSEGCSSVTVPEAVLNEFKQMKTRRKYKYMIITLNGVTFEAEIAKTGAPGSTARDFIKALPGTDARYGIYDHEYTTRDGRKTDKLFFILWTPESAGGRAKMFYTTQRRALDVAFTGIEDAQCSNTDQLAKLLGEKSMEVEETADWDPDA